MYFALLYKVTNRFTLTEGDRECKLPCKKLAYFIRELYPK